MRREGGKAVEGRKGEGRGGLGLLPPSPPPPISLHFSSGVSHKYVPPILYVVHSSMVV